MRFSTAAASSEGGRRNNEDCLDYRTRPAGDACWVVADGLGGHYGGELASQAATQGFMASFMEQPGPLGGESLRRHLQAAHQAVLRRQAGDLRLAAMRTTLVALASDGASACWGHVGDSRLYFFRGGKLAARTKDHSVPQAMVDAGEIRPEDIRRHEDRNRLLRDVGGEKGIKPALLAAPEPLRGGDAFLLCTDGFWECVTETAMEADLAKSKTPAQWLAAMERRIRRQLAEGDDNYSAIAVFVAGP